MDPISRHHRLRVARVTVVVSLALTATPTFAIDPPAPVTTAPFVESSRRVSVHLSFSHWFSGALGQPDGYLTPALAIGVRPGVRNLELGLRYSVAPGRLTLPSGARSVVGFASFEVLASREMRVGRQALRVFAGPFGAIVHTEGSSVGYGVGLAAGAELTFGVAGRADVGIGPFFAARGVYYALPGDAAPAAIDDGWRRDAQIDLGVVLSFL